MSNKHRYTTLFNILVLSIIISFHGSVCYILPTHHPIRSNRRCHHHHHTIENSVKSRQRCRYVAEVNEVKKIEMLRATRLSMLVDSTDFINMFAQNGVVAEETIPIAGGIVAAIALLLLIPPSRLISIGDLNSIVTGTYLERNKNQLRCVYKASKDGWSAIAFHNAVDEKGSGIVVARTITGTTFGGYNPNGWRSTDDYYSSSAAFLWCYGNSKKIVKLPTLPGGNCAVFDYATSGPCFGAADLIIGPPQAAIMGGFAGPDAEDISKSAGSLRQCKSSVGATYDYIRAWPIRGSVRLSDVEVYCLTNLN